MRKSFYFLAASLLLASCSDNTLIDEPVIEEIVDDSGEDNPSNVIPIPRRDITLNSVESSLATQKIDFSTKLFKAAQSDLRDGNFVVSPYSVSTALSMLANGAAGNTGTELRRALFGEDCELSDLNEFNNRLAYEITTLDNLTQLEFANAVFFDNKQSIIVDQFLNNNKAFYNASIIPLYFENWFDCLPIFNKWVSDATHELIKEMPIMNYSPAIIANTIYFKSSWEQCFEKSKTTEATFYNYDGTESTVKMMQGNNYSYAIDDKFAIIEIPYGNRAFSMYIAYSIDEKDSSLDGIENIITKDKIKKYISYTSLGQGYIKLPRFELRAIGDVNTFLEKIGINDLFDREKVDLTNLFGNESKYSHFPPSVTHDCVLKVDESGTEGAALTYIIWCTSPGPGVTVEPKSFTVDRPFVFWIAEKSTGTMLFMGQIVKM